MSVVVNEKNVHKVPVRILKVDEKDVYKVPERILGAQCAYWPGRIVC